MVIGYLPSQCFTCGTPLTEEMKEDYVEGVYINREQPKHVLARIARKFFPKTNKINLCCSGNLMTQIIGPKDIDYVQKKVQ